VKNDGEIRNKQVQCSKHILKLDSKQAYLALIKLSHLSENIYNIRLYSVRQHFIGTKKYLNYNKNYHLCKTNENYMLIDTAAAQQTYLKIEENFKSFSANLKIKTEKLESQICIARNGVTRLLS